MISRAVFQLNLACFFAWSNSFVILSYPDLEKDYLDQYTTHYDLLNKNEPPFKGDEVHLSQMCTALSISNKYKMLDPMEARRSIEYFSKTEHLKATKNTHYEIRYQNFEIKFPQMDNVYKTVKLFPCPKQIKSQYWFIGYGIKEDTKYLFVQTDIESPIRLDGLIEPSSEVDRAMSFSRSYLEKNFINIMNQQRKWTVSITNHDLLCSINCTELFLLGSLIYDVVTEKTFAIRTVYTENPCDHVTPSACLTNQKIAIDEIQKSPGKYQREEICANVVVYHQTSNRRQSHIFYLTQDPRTEDAIFLLENGGNENKMKFIVKSHIQNLSILKYIHEGQS